jgi:hypothetical protein
VLPGPPVSAPRRATPLARTPARTPAAATGTQRRPTPPVSRAIPRHARRNPPLFAARTREACAARRCWSSPEPSRSCRVGPCHRTPDPSSVSPATRRRTSDPHPSSASPASASKSVGHHVALSSLSPLALLRPWPRERSMLPSLSCLSSTLVTESPRSSSPSDRCRCHFSPHGETCLFATLALFGAALTSLILPRNSRS